MTDLTAAQHQAERTIAALRGILGDGLLAVWLHGSAVNGGLRPQSDLDLMAVVSDALTEQQRDEILSTLLQLSSRHPTGPDAPRCLEVIAFHFADFVDIGTKARAEFIYGEWLRAAFEAGERLVSCSNPDNTLILAQARRRSVSLYGPAAAEIVPEISPLQVLGAMQQAIPGLLHGLVGDERNVLLTLARMWHTARTGEFVSKDQAAVWAIAQIQTDDADLLDLARRAYLGAAVDEWGGRAKSARRLAAFLADQVTA
jgi:predicted nucleotidyltransferase